MSRIVHHDLMSTDQAGSVRFYAELFDWKATEIKVMGFTVVRLTHGDDVLGAIMPFDAKLGYPSHWVPYVSVASVDDSCKAVSDLGGEVCMGAMDIPPGRFALANDPAKALFSPFTPKTPISQPRQRPGVFCLDELVTTDVSSAATFYRKLFGWTQREDVARAGEGSLELCDEGSPVAGIRTLDAASSGSRPRWRAYVAVGDLEAAVARAQKMGGKISRPPRAGGEGRDAVLLDPSGGEIGLRAVGQG